MRKIIKNKKGFSLVELLITIAILGIVAGFAFLTLIGVLNSTNQKVDYKTAALIERAVEAYIFLTEDSELKHLSYNKNKIKNGDKSADLILALQHTIVYDKSGEEFQPFLTPKDGTTPSADNFATKCEDHEGYKIEIYSKNMTCNVYPVNNADDAVIVVNN